LLSLRVERILDHIKVMSQSIMTSF